jgi:hypothetical protein
MTSKLDIGEAQWLQSLIAALDCSPGRSGGAAPEGSPASKCGDSLRLRSSAGGTALPKDVFWIVRDVVPFE